MKKTGSAMRISSRISHPVWQLRHYLVDYKWMDFAEVRATELQCLLKAVAGKEMGKRTFQKLPCHMRHTKDIFVCVHSFMCVCVCVSVCIRPGFLNAFSFC